MHLGELSLDGRLNRISGALPLAIGLRNQGVDKIILPEDNAEEVSAINDIELYPAGTLRDIEVHFSGSKKIMPFKRLSQINQPSAAAQISVKWRDRRL